MNQLITSLKPTWRRARRTAHMPKARFRAATPGIRRNGTWGTVQCQKKGPTCCGSRVALCNFVQSLLTSREEVLGARNPGELTHRTGTLEARRWAIWWLL